MTTTTDRQELGKALNNPKKNRIDDVRHGGFVGEDLREEVKF